MSVFVVLLEFPIAMFFVTEYARYYEFPFLIPPIFVCVKIDTAEYIQKNELSNEILFSSHKTHTIGFDRGIIIDF